MFLNPMLKQTMPSVDTVIELYTQERVQRWRNDRLFLQWAFFGFWRRESDKKLCDIGLKGPPNVNIIIWLYVILCFLCRDIHIKLFHNFDFYKNAHKLEVWHHKVNLSPQFSSFFSAYLSRNNVIQTNQWKIYLLSALLKNNIPN